jgi:hypothetical protein
MENVVGNQGLDQGGGRLLRPRQHGGPGLSLQHRHRSLDNTSGEYTVEKGSIPTRLPLWKSHSQTVTKLI